MLVSVNASDAPSRTGPRPVESSAAELELEIVSPLAAGVRYQSVRAEEAQRMRSKFQQPSAAALDPNPL